MKKTKLIISLVLAFCLLLSVMAGFAGCKKPTPPDPVDPSKFPTDGRLYNDFKVGGQVILGNSTQVSGINSR